MRVLFIVCAVLGTVGICGLLVMLLFFRLKINLGFRLPKGRTIPIEQFIPQGIYGYAVFTAVFGYFGLMLLQLSLPWYFIVPADIAMGFIVNFIAGSGYGKVRVKYNGLNYRFDAISVYHTDIESGEKVDIVTGEDELLFVQKKDEIYKVLDEEKTPATKAETDITPEPKRKNDSFVSSEEINNNRKEE